LFKPLLVVLGLLIVWESIVVLFAMPEYILPGPKAVFTSMYDNASLLWKHTLVTMTEMLLGLILGVLFGILLAMILVYFVALRPWLLPLLLVTQAVPV
ncbi:ABC transporter permease, partial [Pseudoalteromonas sp. S4492]